MKIERTLIHEMTIAEFAEKHNLVMEIHERGLPVGNPGRFYAHFKHADTKEGHILCGEYGDGATPLAAVMAYATAISLKMLVIDAYEDTRREIRVPRLK